MKVTFFALLLTVLFAALSLSVQFSMPDNRTKRKNTASQQQEAQQQRLQQEAAHFHQESAAVALVDAMTDTAPPPALHGTAGLQRDEKVRLSVYPCGACFVWQHTCFTG